MATGPGTRRRSSPARVSAASRVARLRVMITASARSSASQLSRQGPAGRGHRTDRVVSALIAKKAGTQLSAVPTRGGAEAVTQVMGGHVDLAYSSGAYVPQAKAGQVKVLAVLGDNRIAAFPDAPTLLELGYDLASVNLIVFMAPKGIPTDIRAKLTAAFAAAAKDEKIVDLMDKRTLGDTILIGDDLTGAMRAHSARFKQMIDRSKAQ